VSTTTAVRAHVEGAFSGKSAGSSTGENGRVFCSRDGLAVSNVPLLTGRGNSKPVSNTTTDQSCRLLEGHPSYRELDALDEPEWDVPLFAGGTNHTHRRHGGRAVVNALNRLRGDDSLWESQKAGTGLPFELKKLLIHLCVGLIHGAYGLRMP